MKPTRVYKTEEIAVEWRPELCVHCRVCITGLPQVFDMNARPWVNIGGASSAEITRQVGECPSGALAMGVVE